jgi:hypothetical protein
MRLHFMNRTRELAKLTRGESGLFIRKLAISSIVNIQSKIDNQYASPSPQTPQEVKQ